MDTTPRETLDANAPARQPTVHHVVHIDERDPLRFRIWSVSTNAYVTESLTAEEVRAWIERDATHPECICGTCDFLDIAPGHCCRQHPPGTIYFDQPTNDPVCWHCASGDPKGGRQ